MNDQTSKINLKPAPEAPAAAAESKPKATAPAHAPQDAPAEAKPFPFTPLIEKRCKTIVFSSDDVGNMHRITTPTGTPFEHVLSDAFWTNCAQKLRQGDLIQVWTDDMTYFGWVAVVEVGASARGGLNNRATVAFISQHDISTAQSMRRVEEYVVVRKGDFLKWCVVRVSDGSYVHQEIYTQEEAEAKLRAHVRAVSETKKRAAA